MLTQLHTHSDLEVCQLAARLEQLQGVLYVPFDQQSGSSHLRALDCESAPSEWITEAFASEKSQIPGDTVHKHHQAPSEHLPINKSMGGGQVGIRILKFNIFSKCTDKRNVKLSPNYIL